jgi:hypothetical protein
MDSDNQRIQKLINPSGFPMTTKTAAVRLQITILSWAPQGALALVRIYEDESKGKSKVAPVLN